MSRRVLCCVALLASACSGNQSVLNPQGPAARNIAGLTWIFFVYRHDPYVDVRPQLVRLRAWARA